MCDYQIKNSMGHYYVVSEYLVNSNEEYLVKMLTENNIKWHLSCKVSYEGSKQVLLYDITNMISLEKEYENKYLEFDELKEIFESINYAFSVGNNYLLDEKYYNLNPSYIFKDMENGEIKLLYLPGYISREENRYYPLADFLLQRVNRKCVSCIQVTYQFYRMTKAETFSISMFLNIIDKEQIIHKQPAEIHLIDNKKTEEIIEVTEQEKNMKYIVPICMTGLLVVTALIYGFMLRNTFYAIYGLAAVIALTVFSVMLWLKEIYLIIKSRNDNEYKAVCEESSIEKYWEDEDTIVIDDDVSGENSSMDGLLHLEWKEKNKQRKYNIKSFPIIIGKINEEVDCVIDDESISRLHAKIVRRNNGIFIFDLNSTNGTSINGRKLLPGEETAVSGSSEILLGNVTVKLV